MKIRTSLKKHKNILLFLSILFIFGIITGILFYFKQDIGLKKTILLNIDNVFKHNVFSLKNIFIHICLILIIIASCFLFLGTLILIGILFLEGIGIGFLIPMLFSLYKWKFILHFSLYFILIKMVYILLLFYLFYYLIQFLKNYFYYLKSKKINFLPFLKRAFLIGIFLIMNDLFVYFISNKVLIFIFH